MNKNTGLIIGLVFVGICIVAGIFIFSFDRSKSTDSSSSSSNVVVSTTAEFTNSSITEFNGKNGKKCYVAVDGKVYDMSNFSLWRNGIHSTSEGRASCGKDLTTIMPTAPHGKSKLSIMPQVGVFK